MSTEWYWLTITSYNTSTESAADIETIKLVTISEFLSPINFPKKPEIIEANKGNAIIKISIYPFSLSISSTRIVPEFL